MIDLGHLLTTRWIVGQNLPFELWGPAGTKPQMDKLLDYLDWDIEIRRAHMIKRDRPRVAVTEIEEVRRERTVIVYTYIKPERFLAQVGALREFLHRFGRETNQEVVVAELSGAGSTTTDGGTYGSQTENHEPFRWRDSTWGDCRPVSRSRGDCQSARRRRDRIKRECSGRPDQPARIAARAGEQGSVNGRAAGPRRRNQDPEDSAETRGLVATRKASRRALAAGRLGDSWPSRKRHGPQPTGAPCNVRYASNPNFSACLRPSPDDPVPFQAWSARPRRRRAGLLIPSPPERVG